MNFFRETAIIFERQILGNLRNPAWVLIGIFQPIMYLLLFGPLLKPLVAQFGATNAYTFFVPGLLIQLSVFGAMFAGFATIGEWREGVIEAERVSPANRAALLMGRVCRDMAQILVQSLILIGLGLLLGMKVDAVGAALGVVITVLVGGACAAASASLALLTKSEDVMGPVINMVLMPVLLLSGILLPMTLGPTWLQRASDFMPFKWVVQAARDSFVGSLGTSNIAWGVTAALTLFALGIAWGTSVFRKENA